MSNDEITICLAEETHWSQIFEIFSKVIKTEDTFVYSSNTTEQEARNIWFSSNFTVFVAISSKENNVVGSYIIRPNFPGLGSHICNCAYMVDPEVRGRGIAQKMCQHSMEFARQNNYIGMQYNCVVSTNTRAVKLWQMMGFTIIGTSPKAFKHPQLGYVDTFMMHKML